MTHTIDNSDNNIYKTHISLLTLNNIYISLMSLFSLFLFLCTLIIPYWYDQCNLTKYLKSKSEDNLLVREYGNVILTHELDVNKLNPIKHSFNYLINKNLISMDYIHQMEDASKIKRPEFFRYMALVSIILFVFIFLVLKYIHIYIYRTPLIGILFIVALLTMQAFGLPHVNTKFHIIFGLLYASFLSLSDFVYTLDLRLINIKRDIKAVDCDGLLSLLQYKHRYWTVMFHLQILTLITLFATVSFNLLDYFIIVFGESFVIHPLLGVLFALGVLLFGVLIGILRPMRKHLASIEYCMLGNK